jgi:hypothetical protein
MTDVAPQSAASPTNVPGVHVGPTSAEAAEPQLISRSAALRLAGGVCGETLIRALTRGDVRGRFIAGRWFFDVESVRRWSEARRAARGGRPERRGRPRRLVTAHSAEEELNGK